MILTNWGSQRERQFRTRKKRGESEGHSLPESTEGGICQDLERKKEGERGALTF
jgi:hypothetical protein